MSRRALCAVLALSGIAALLPEVRVAFVIGTSFRSAVIALVVLAGAASAALSITRTRRSAKRIGRHLLRFGLGAAVVIAVSGGGVEVPPAGAELSGPPDANGKWAHCNVAVSDSRSDHWRLVDIAVACQYGPTTSPVGGIHVTVPTTDTDAPTGQPALRISFTGEALTFAGGQATGHRTGVQCPYRGYPYDYGGCDRETYDFAKTTCTINIAGNSRPCDVLNSGADAEVDVLMPYDSFPGGTAGDVDLDAEQLIGGCALDGDAAAPCNHQADPVIGATGWFTHSEVDVRLPGFGPPVEIKRTYTSGDETSGPLGRGWSLNFGSKLTIAGNGDVTLSTTTGQNVVFTRRIDGTYQGPPGGRSTLASTSGGYELARKDHTTHVFDASGWLTKIRDTAGREVSLAYDAGRLDTIVDAAGRTTTVTQHDAAGRIEDILLPDGRTLAYRYDPDGYLTSFTNPNGKTTTYTYDDDTYLALDGDDDHVAVANHPAYANGGALTLEAIVRFDAIDSRVQRIVSRQAHPHMWYLRANGNRLQAAFFDSTGVGRTVASTTILKPGTWYSVAATLEAGVVRLFVNGAQESSASFIPTGNFNTTAPISFGQYDDAPAISGEHLAGEIAETRLWTVARSPEQIHASMAEGGALAGSEAGLKGYWKLKGGSGTAVPDASPTMNAGTLLGGARWPDGKRMTAIVDATDRRLIENTYGSDGRVISQRDAFDNPTNFLSVRQGAHGFASVMIDAKGHSWIDRYRANVLQSREYPSGEIVDYEFDSDLQLANVPRAGGSGWLLEWEDGRVTKRHSVAPFDYEETFEYYPDGRLQTFTDGLDRPTGYEYHPDGSVEKITESDGSTTLVTPDPQTGLPATVVDARGKTWTYDYDDDGNLIEQVTPSGHRSTMTYDSNGFLETYTDPRGNVAGGSAVAADDGGLLADIGDLLGGLLGTDPPSASTAVAGYTWTYDHDVAGNLLSVSDPLGGETAYTYDDAGRLETKTDPRGKVWSYSYNAAGELETVTAPDQSVTSYGYDSSGHLETETDPEGGQTTYDYDDAGRLASKTDARGKTWTYAYDAAGNRISETSPEGGETSFDYDVLGRLTSRTSPRGNAAGADAEDFTTTYTYDAAGNVTAERDPLGFTTAYGDLDARNNARSVVDQAGKETTRTFDPLGNLLAVTDPLAHTVANTYDDDGRLAVTTDQRGKTTTFGYDPVGNLVSERSPLGHTTSMTYDALNRLATRTDPRGNAAGANPALFTSSYGYDAGGNLTSETDALGRATTFGYDDVGNQIRKTDALNRQTTYGYDGNGRMVSLLASDGALSRWGYDRAGNLTSRTDANDHTTTLTYDDDGRLNSERTPLGRERTYTHDADGNLATEGDPRGNVTPAAGDYTITRSHDPLGRLTAVDYSDSTPDVAFTYDARGLRTFMDDGPGSETRTYDDAGRLASVSRGGTSAISYGHDAAGNVTQRSYGGVVSNRTFDDDGLLKAVSGPGGTATYTRDAAGRPTALARGNGAWTSWGYDRVGRTSSVAHGRGSSETSRFAYAYDAVGNPTSITTPEGTNTFRYDAQDRLTAECYLTPCGIGSVPTYTYDAVGNRKTMQSLTGPVIYTYDADDQMTSVAAPEGTRTYTYDAAGNMTTTGISIHTYDLAGRTRSVEDNGAPHAYIYDGDGKRVSATRSGLLGPSYNASYVWDPNGAIPEVVGSSGSDGELRYVHGEDLLSSTAGSATSWYHADSLGSVTSVTDGAGEEDWAYRYGAFGTERLALQRDLAAPAQPMRYTGEHLDPTGHYHLRARNYDAGLGRFTQRDPLAPPDAKPLVGSYVYADDRPSVLVDPRGTFTQAPTAAPPMPPSVAPKPAPRPIGPSLTTCGPGGTYCLLIADGAMDYVIDMATGDKPSHRGEAKPAPQPVREPEDGKASTGTSQCDAGQSSDECSERWVIGESFKGRLMLAAAAHSARAWEGPPPGSSHLQTCAANDAWLRGVMNRGGRIIDIGIDENRQGNRSPYYELERRIIAATSYPVEKRPWPASVAPYPGVREGPCP